MLAASAPRYTFGDKHLAFVRSVVRFLLSHQVRALAESLVEKRFNIIIVPTRPIIIAERKTSARVENVMRLAKDVTLPPALLPRGVLPYPNKFTARTRNWSFRSPISRRHWRAPDTLECTNMTTGPDEPASR